MCRGGNFPCYAYRLANGRLRNRYLANKNTATRNYDEDSYPFYPRFWPERLKAPSIKPWILQRMKGIFVCDMGELFGSWIPDDWQEKIFAVIKTCPQHRFYLLTKQPQNLIKFSPFPDNCWVGVTATTYKQFQDALEGLCQIVAKRKYISFEPLLESIEIWHSSKTQDNDFTIGGGIDWLIIGAQTKPTVYPKDVWVWEIEQAADKAEIPVFEKNNLYPAGFRHLLRQEMPK